MSNVRDSQLTKKQFSKETKNKQNTKKVNTNSNNDSNTNSNTNPNSNNKHDANDSKDKQDTTHDNIYDKHDKHSYIIGKLHEAPKFLHDNEYILKGYRIGFNSLNKVFRRYN